SEREADRDIEVAGQRERGHGQPRRDVADDDHPAQRETRPDEADDEAAKQVAGPDRALHERVDGGAIERRAVDDIAGVDRHEREQDPDHELAERRLEGVREEDRLAPQEAPALPELLEEARLLL